MRVSVDWHRAGRPNDGHLPTKRPGVGDIVFFWDILAQRGHAGIIIYRPAKVRLRFWCDGVAMLQRRRSSMNEAIEAQ
jgi:hypothetical protein